MNNPRFIAFALIGFGIIALASRFGGDTGWLWNTGWLWVGLVAAGFLMAYSRKRTYRFLVAGSILAGIAAGILLEQTWGWDGIFLIGLGLGFFAIDQVERRPNRWPRIVAAILIGLGLLSGLSDSGIFGSVWFAIALIAGGIYLLKRLRAISTDRRATVESMSEVRIAPKSAGRWIGPDGKASVAGRKIGGMIYLGSEALRENWNREGSALIDPSLPVAAVGSDLPGESMPYWPSYSDINPQARATYLDWLAGGRSGKQYGPGYIFLYFYGLERRFFVDAPDEEEKRLLVTETERLLGVYGENHSVQRYLRDFLDAARVVLKPASDTGLRFERSGYELPLGLRVTIGRMVKEGQPLSADWLLSWYTNHPATVLRTPATRAFPEFRALFTLLFDERFPEGLKVDTPRKLLRARYTAASGAFEVDLKHFLGDTPDISGTSKPLTVAKELVEVATDALDKYSRFLGRNPEGRDTISAHALLPEPLWLLFPCAEMEDIHCWAEGIIGTGGLAPVEQVIERLEGAPPEKVAKRQLIGAADALARLSVGMAPDPRFALRSPKLGEPVVLFRLPEGITALEEVSEKYKDILVAITMGGFIAHADGTVATKERRALEARIDAADLSGAERARLLANLQWILAVPPNVSLFRQRLQDIPASARRELGQVALAMAVADSAIDPGEIKAIERLYKAMGLTTDGIYSDLHILTARSEPVTVRSADEQEQDFTIPLPPECDGKVALDAGRLASVMADTARVSSVLGDIFRYDESEEEPDETPEDVQGNFPGLDARHATFLHELLTHSYWDEAGFATLTAQFRLMQAGALETLNEWSFERFGDMLIEEYEGYELNPDIVAELQEWGRTYANPKDQTA